MLRLKNPLGGNSEFSAYGDKNVIEGIQVDGVDLIPDSNKKVNIDLSDKVGKEDGKGLSSNDFTDELKEKLEDIEDDADVNIIEGVQVDGVDLVPNANKKVNIDLSDKVGKEDGKGLSSNDFTDELKQKLEDIEDDADVNIIEGVQVDGVDLVPNATKKVNIDLSGKQNVLTFDNVPTEGSNNPVKSGGTFSAIDDVNSDLQDTKNRVTAVEEDIIAKTAEAQQVTQELTDTISGVNTDLQGAKGRISTIEGKIPNQASSQNQVADKEFVNSSIARETAYFISNSGEPFTSVAQLLAYAGEITNNDYAYVTGQDNDGNTYFDCYKYSSRTGSWGKEYRLNNSSFTAVQWAAITSGITAQLVGQITANQQAILQLALDLANKVDKVAGKGLSTNDFDNTAKQKVTDAYVKPQTGIPKSDLASDVTSHWNLLGETLLTDNASVTGLTVTPTGNNAGFLQNYSKFKVVIEINPADTTATVFNPKLYFRRNGGLSGRIYESPGTSFGSLKLQSDNKFYAVFILEKMTDDIMQTTLMPQGNNYTGQATFFGGQVFGAFTTDVSSILADDIFFRNFESTASISTGSSMKLYAWEE